MQGTLKLFIERTENHKIFIYR